MLSCITGATFSQSKLPIKLGLQVAPNIGWMNPSTKGYSSDGARFGGTIGFVGDFYFAENYAVSTGMNFQFMNGKLTYADPKSQNPKNPRSTGIHSNSPPIERNTAKYPARGKRSAAKNQRIPSCLPATISKSDKGYVKRSSKVS